MTKVFKLVVAASLGLLVVAVLVFHFALDMALIDAFYFAVTTMTTVGYSDFALAAAPPAVKLFGVALMAGGALSLAAVFGMVTDYLLGERIERLLRGRKKKAMKDHVVLCGLGHVGTRILERLVALGEDVVAIEWRSDEPRRAIVDEHHATLIEGDQRHESVLREAQIERAKAIVLASDDDLANLETALTARELNPDVRIVMRMYDEHLADKVGHAFDISTVMSTSSLAGPVFAHKAVDPAVMGGFRIGDDVLLNVEVEVTGGSKMDGLTISELKRLGEGNLTVLGHQPTGSDQRQLHPAGRTRIGASDRLLICTSFAYRQQLRAWSDG